MAAVLWTGIYMRLRDNRAIYIKFWDHTTGSLKPQLCEVLGFIVEETEKHIGLSYWIPQTKCDDEFKHNIETFCILKSAIIKRRNIKIT